MKKFKHKITKNIIWMDSDGNYRTLNDNLFIPKWIIDNSNDWEEIVEKPVLFTTEDGVGIFEGDKSVYIVSNWIPIIQNVFSNEWGNTKSAYKLVFSTKEAAEEYIDRNKPVFSKNDVNEIMGRFICDGLSLESIMELQKNKL